MNNHYKITIPEPCHEDWNEMTPNKEGRFCMNCSKTVTDFSTMSADEIQHFFIENQNKKICGSFKNEQLKRLIIQIPNHVLYTQTSYHKMFLLALFVAMGTTLFSCQDKEGKKQKIDKIEVIKDSIALKIIPNKDTAKIKEPVVKPPVPSMPETVIYRTTGEIIVEDYPEQPEKHIDYCCCTLLLSIAISLKILLSKKGFTENTFYNIVCFNSFMVIVCLYMTYLF